MANKKFRRSKPKPLLSPSITESTNPGIFPYADRIVGGTEVDPACPDCKYPFMGSIQKWGELPDWPQGDHICGGVLIHPEWLLTAAHCTAGNFPPHQVEFGTHYVNFWNTEVVPETQGSVTYEIAQIITHPSYIPADWSNSIATIFDIALIRLYEPVINFEPIPLISNSEYDNDGTIGTVMGWGSTAGFGQPGSPELREATLVVDDSCGLGYGDMISPDHLCAGALPDSTDSAGHCAGDSGGPLITDTANGYELIGIVSWTGGNCQDGWDYPSVYTRVDGVQNWINDTIANPPALWETWTYIECETVRPEHMSWFTDIEFCYPDQSSEIYSTMFNGNTYFNINDVYGGIVGTNNNPAYPNKVLVLVLSTSWCGPCIESVPTLEELFNEFKDHPDFMMVDVMMDLGQPYNCNMWGEHGESGIFPIIDDGGYGDGFGNYHEIFSNSSGIPRIVIFTKEGRIKWLPSWMVANSSNTYNYIEGALNGENVCPSPIYGCSDVSACNYDADTELEDGSCLYPCSIPYGCPVSDLNFDCDGNCISQNCVVTLDYFLNTGFNLISVPLVYPEGLSVSGEISSIFSSSVYAGIVNSVLSESAVASMIGGQWYGSISEFEKNKGYWIVVSSDVSISIPGIPWLNPTYQLNEGNNLISFPGFTPIPIAEALQGYEDVINGVIGYGEAVSMLDGSWWGSLSEFKVGGGYWFQVNQDVTFQYNLMPVSSTSQNYIPVDISLPQDLAEANINDVFDDIANQVDSFKPTYKNKKFRRRKN